MLRIITLLILITLSSYVTTTGQAHQNFEKFQTISIKNASQIVVTDESSDHFNFGDNLVNETSVIVKIEVTSETFPSRILKAMMEQGDFNIRYKNSNGQIILSQLKKNQEIRFSGKTHTLDFNYEILVPNALAYEN